MLLTSLEIIGFKSFADRTKFVFDQGITGIVGPNGCGKSNIVDSIRWVLGEQKTKNLRSDKMENIIFNGTQGRRKSNFAEVSLTFENTKNILPTEYTTITITRKLYRSGESEYLINGVTCRLKDIHNLFMDTGVGSDSYAIIELKMVDEILTNKNNERRKFFEEASGISKYKTRKKQTLKRLSDTDADLERVEDLLYEIEKNLKSLERQAKRTQRYFELKQTYKHISSQYAFLLSKNIRERKDQLTSYTQKLQEDQVALQSKYAQQEARIQELKRQQLDEEKQLAKFQENLNKHLSHIQEVETQKSIKNERLKYLQQRELAINQQLANERNQLQENEQQVDVLTQDLEKHQLLTRQKTESLEEIGQQLQGKRSLWESHREESQEIQQGVREREQELQKLFREKDVIQVRLESLSKELTRTQEDQHHRNDDLGSFSEKSQLLTKEVDSLSGQVEKLETLKSKQKTLLEELEEKIGKAKDEIYKINRVLDAKQNEFNLTKDLVQNLEGFPESVKFLKKNARWIREAPLVSDIISCPDSYRVALENYLEPYLSYYVVPTRKDAILSVHMLADATKGRANFFILEELETYKAQNPLIFTQAEAALDVVDFPTKFRKLASYLLDGVYFVPGEEELPEELPEQATFLTQAGNMSRKRFVISGGSLGLFEGKRLGRAGNLEKLEKEIVKLEKQLIEKKSALEKHQSKFQKEKHNSYEKDLESSQKQLIEKQGDLSVLKSREKEHLDFLERVGRRKAELEEESRKLSEQQETLLPQLKHLEEELTQYKSRYAHQQAVEQEALTQVNSLNQVFNEAQIATIQQQNQLDNILRDMKQKKDRIEVLHSNQKQLKEETFKVRSDIEALVNSNTQDDETVILLYEQKKSKEQDTDLQEQKVAMIRSSIHQVESNLSALRQQREELLQKQATYKERETEIRLEVNSLKERMAVEFEIDIETLSEKEVFGETPMEKFDMSALEEKVQSQRLKIQNYGEINPMAVETYNEMKERFDFMEEQKQDLLDAKASLQETIKEIDDTAKERFMETFVEVRENFHQVFRSLFSESDTCDLILLNPDDPLDSDISIIARPKGKRPLTISQLSGGEKTLTAVALLFSIYLIKPAPFCIFDEVDAPLDDANIDKFNNIIKKFSADSQFIIVTHNKRTMASTQIMYGVTMENRGVSRVLPVSLEALNLN